MPASRPVPARLRAEPFSTSRGLELVSPGDLRGPGYRRLTRGVYQDTDSPTGFSEKIRAMRLIVAPDAPLGGIAAAWALGVRLAGPADPVEFVTTASRRRRAGLLLRAEVLAGHELVMTPYGPASSPARTAFDLARSARIPRAAVRQMLQLLHRDTSLRAWPPPPNALFGFSHSSTGSDPAAAVARRLVTTVARVDALLTAHHLDAAALSMLIERHPGVRGLWSVRLVAELVDPRADSPPESVLRVRITLAGLPRPIPQFEIRDANGIFVAKPDLGWPELELGGEYDGAHHDEKPQIRKDRQRDIRGHRVRWRLLHFDSASVRNLPSLIADTHAVMLQQQQALRDRR